tara:strand:+ start:101 stop:286 length:186 start_codon:yes stop_codon:yes gene_type:complete
MVMNMSTFSFIIAILMSAMSLGFGLVGVSMGDPVAQGMSEILLIAVGVFFFAGIVMFLRGE